MVRLDEGLAVWAGIPREPLHARTVGGQGKRVVFAGDFDERVRDDPGGQALEDRADRRSGGLVTGEEQALSGAGVEVDALRGLGASGVGPDDEDPVSDRRGFGPGSGGTGVVVEDEVDVELERLGVDPSHGVGAERHPLLVGEVAPTRVPLAVVDGGGIGLPDVAQGAVGTGEHDLHALVTAVGAEDVEVG